MEEPEIEMGGRMYGGNDKSLERLVEDVLKTVIGQDEAVRWICGFLDAASARSRIISERRVDSLSMPRMGSALIVGPTASGKTHMLKTVAKQSGMLFMEIDASAMTAEGYKGASFSSQWVRAAAALGDNPNKNLIVFVDEVDKMFAASQFREVSPVYDLLKPLEGGIIEGGDGSEREPRFYLDCDRCVFVLAGAFTGIEEIIASRLGISRSVTGFAPAPRRDGGEGPATEEALRAQLTLEDIEKWGAPRELVGRISTVRFLSALGENDLREIVRRNKVVEYRRMLPSGTAFVIDDSAEDLLVANALAAHYGARFINQQINGVFCGELRYQLGQRDDVVGVALTARDGKLAFDLAYGVRKPADEGPDQSEDDVLTASLGYGLLWCVHTYIDAHGFVEETDDWSVLLDDGIAFAAALLCLTARDYASGKIKPAQDYTLAEIALLIALASLLHDWFPHEDQNVDGLCVLLSMAEWDCVPTCPLDLLFGQLRNGRRYIPSGEQGEDVQREGSWSWQPSNMVRNGDGLRPAECGGLRRGQDRALDCFEEFMDFSVETRREAVKRLAFRLTYCCG